MRGRRLELRLAAWLLAGLGCLLGAADGHARLPEPVKRTLVALRVPESRVGLMVQALDAAQPTVAHNVDQPFNPASTMKLVTTFCALEVLTPAHRFVTEAYAGGPVRNGRLQGDLVLRGGGDPMFVEQDLRELVWALRDRGIAEIDGDLVLDTRLFDLPTHDPGAFDNRPLRSYNVGPDALLFNFQTLRFRLIPDPQAGEVRVTTRPRPANLVVKNGLRYRNTRCGSAARRLRMSRGDDVTTVLAGLYPGSCGEVVLNRSVMPNDAFLFGTFKTLWLEAGGAFSGRLGTGAAPDGAEPIALHRSRSLGEMVRGINKYSNNVMTRQLLLALGVHGAEAPGTLDKGRAAIAQCLSERGISMPSLVVDNGSGLSRTARASPRGLANLLLAAAQSRFYGDFLASLPLSGLDGTLRSRLDNPAFQGRLQLKTGSLRNAKALAGFVLDDSGRRYAVALLINDSRLQGWEFTRVEQALAAWLISR